MKTVCGICFGLFPSGYFLLVNQSIIFLRGWKLGLISICSIEPKTSYFSFASNVYNLFLFSFLSLRSAVSFELDVPAIADRSPSFFFSSSTCWSGRPYHVLGRALSGEPDRPEVRGVSAGNGVYGGQGVAQGRTKDRWEAARRRLRKQIQQQR